MFKLNKPNNKMNYKVQSNKKTNKQFFLFKGFKSSVSFSQLDTS